MSDEAIWTYQSQVTLEASGASAASSAMVAAADAALSSANHSNFPLADFALTCDFGAAIAGGTTIALFRQDLAIDGAANAPAPAASTYEECLVGLFRLPSGQSASATYSLPDVPLTKECQFSIMNNTAQTMSAGWVLKVTPKTMEPSA